MNILKWTLLFPFLIALPLHAINYTLEDLQVLEKEGDLVELLHHAKDVRPSKRDHVWKKMVLDAAIKQTTSWHDQKVFERKDFKLLQKIGLWNNLSTSVDFMTISNQYAKRYIQNCIEKKYDYCLDDLFSFWHSSNKTAETAYFTAVRIEKLAPQINLWPFISHLTKSEDAKKYCESDLVKEETLKKLKEVILVTDKRKRVLSKMDLYLNDQCFLAFQAELKNALLKDDQNQKIFAYTLLNAKKMLNEREKDLFLTIYLLGSPIVGDTFNEAWSNLIKIGANHKRRSGLFRQMTQIDPLPDDIFSHPDELKKKTVFNLFKSNFPEYLEHYAKTCVQFLAGEKVFEAGNPTIHCNEFYELEKNRPMLDQRIRSRFSALKK